MIYPECKYVYEKFEETFNIFLSCSNIMVQLLQIKDLFNHDQKFNDTNRQIIFLSAVISQINEHFGQVIHTNLRRVTDSVKFENTVST